MINKKKTSSIKKDIRFVIILFSTIIGVSICLLFFIIYFFEEDSKKIIMTKDRLFLISEKIQEYYINEKKIPSSLIDPSFQKYINRRSIVDPFNSDNKPFHYKLKERKILIYSIGPNSKNDGGVYKENLDSPVLDIPIEIYYNGNKILNFEFLPDD